MAAGETAEHARVVSSATHWHQPRFQVLIFGPQTPPRSPS